jgi:hypothetical protein
MLISFAATNFRSIYERQEISFIATKHGAMPDSLLRASKIPSGLLPALAIYGANASGKTTVLRALHVFGHSIVDSYAKWKPFAKLPYDPHFFHTDEPTKFECTFLFRNEIYRLAFSFNETKFLSESLHVGRTLVYRRNGNSYRLGDDMIGFESIKKSTRPNSLFLSAAAQANHPLISKIYAWFDRWDTITDNRLPEEALAGQLIQNSYLRKFLSKAIAVIAPDVTAIEPGEKPGDEPPSGVDPQLVSMMQRHTIWSNTKFVHLSADGSRTASVYLPDESAGTQCYFALAASIFGVLLTGGLMILDEADQSLHPSLLRSMVLLFQNPSSNPRKAQLIFNTHDTTLLSPEVLRPDQIWFTERDLSGSSRIYCLADFKGIRSDTKAERAYLEGRFGAVPFLERHTQLFAEELAVKSKGKNEKTSHP